jgi:twitching motility protein PilU
MSIEKYLRVMVEQNASDLFITAGVAPSIKVNGKITPLTKAILEAEQSREIVLGLMNENQRTEFITHKECNFAISSAGIGRFRVSAFYQRNVIGMVLRRIETKIPKISELGLPDIVKDLTMSKRGLILFVGGTGTGKSTSLAAMIGHRNENSKGHILSVEDPIEFIHQHKNCIVTQREVGLDTESFDMGLKNALRQAPDVIMIGEVRSSNVMSNAISFAETGHLALATLHANNANQALDRVLHFFPYEQHQQIWLDLSLNLRAIVAQQLVPTIDGKGRRAVVEVLINTPLVSSMIRKGEVGELKELMGRPNDEGMQTFDQSLYALYEAGEISYEEAIAYSDSHNDLRLMIKLGSESDSNQLEAASEGLTLQD